MSATEVEVLVVGAGIAGLAAARDLVAAGVHPLVVDAGPRPGGVMQTVSADGYLMEAGPNTFRASGPLRAFADRHRLWPDLVAAAPESRRRALFHDGRLVDLPRGPWSAVTTPLLSPSGKLRLLAEPLVRRGDPTGESVHEFVARRLGPETATRLVGAFLTGVYAGDERELGVEAVFPGLVALERSHGSLARGGLAALLRRSDPAARGRPGSWSAREGLGGLVQHLVRALPEPVRLGARVESLFREDGVWHADLSGEVVRARQVVLAVPAHAAPPVLEKLDPDAARALASIAYAPVVAVGLGVGPGDVRGAVEGFGFIAPRASGLGLLGCLFMSRLFPGRAPRGQELLHLMLGGARWPEAVELPEDVLLARAREDLDRTLGLRGEPRTVAVRRWPRAIPQPGRDHVRLVAALERRIASAPGLHLAGGYLAGVSVADTVASGVGAAERVLAAGAAHRSR